jgi:hypothetical protein
MPTNYKPILICLMSFVNEEEYDADKNFTLVLISPRVPSHRLFAWPRGLLALLDPRRVPNLGPSCLLHRG